MSGVEDCLVGLMAVSERNRDLESSCVKYYSAAMVCCIAHVLFMGKSRAP